MAIENKNEQPNIGPDHYDLGLRDYAIGVVLWAGRLLTRQMGHEHPEPIVEVLTERSYQMIFPYDESGREVEV